MNILKAVIGVLLLWLIVSSVVLKWADWVTEPALVEPGIVGGALIMDSEDDVTGADLVVLSSSLATPTVVFGAEHDGIFLRGSCVIALFGDKEFYLNLPCQEQLEDVEEVK